MFHIYLHIYGPAVVSYCQPFACFVEEYVGMCVSSELCVYACVFGTHSFIRGALTVFVQRLAAQAVAFISSRYAVHCATRY